MMLNQITHEMIGAAIEVHRCFGPGLAEVIYEDAMAVALHKRQLPFQRQTALPVQYKGVNLNCGFRPDFVVYDLVVGEIKSSESMHAVFDAQVRTYQRLGNWPLGLLLNFNVPVMRDGISRSIVSEKEFPSHRKLSTSGRREQKSSCVIESIIEAAIEVHRNLGPGLLKSVYDVCLCHEFALNNLKFESNRRVELTFHGEKLCHAAQLNLIVADQVLVATLTVQQVLPVHEAQIRSQMRIGKLPVALLLNFHATRITDDLKRLGSLQPVGSNFADEDI